MASQQGPSTIDQTLEDYERKPVPESIARNWLDQTLVWMGITFCLAAWFVGGALTANFGFWTTLVVLALGGVVLAVMGMLTAWIGATTRLSTAMTSRFAYGTMGTNIIGVILSFSLWGWYAFQAGLFGLTGQIALKQAFGIDFPIWPVTLLGGLLMMTTAIVGYRALSLLSRWAVPLMAILAIWALYASFSAHSWAEISSKGPSAQALPLTVGISAVVGTYTVGAMIAPDISRWSRQRSDGLWAALLGFFVTFIPIVWLGTIFSFSWGNPNVVEVMTTQLGLGIFAYIVLILAQWTTNQSNLYSASLALSAVVPWPKWRLSLIIGVASTLLATLELHNNLLAFLNVLSALIPPMVGPIIADFFFFNGAKYRSANMEKVKTINWVSLISWACGALVGFSMSAPPGGFGILPGADVIPVPVVALAVAIVVHVILGFALRKERAYPSAFEAT